MVQKELAPLNGCPNPPNKRVNLSKPNPKISFPNNNNKLGMFAPP